MYPTSGLGALIIGGLINYDNSTVKELCDWRTYYFISTSSKNANFAEIIANSFHFSLSWRFPLTKSTLHVKELTLNLCTNDIND